MSNQAEGPGAQEPASAWSAGSQQPPAPADAPQETDGYAIASLVLGILSLVCVGLLAAIPGLILGLVALRRIREAGGNIGGRGMAMAGIVCSVVGIVFGVIWIGFWLIGMLATAARM